MSPTGEGVRFTIKPQGRRYFELFSKEARISLAAAERYHAMMLDFADPAAAATEILELEHRPDEVTHEVAAMLGKMFVTPLDHGDIHALVSEIDDVTDLIEAATDNCVLHAIERPTEQAREQARLLVAACAAMASAVEQLRPPKELAGAIAEVHRIEKEADRIHRTAIAELFDGAHPAMVILKWREIYEQIEAAIDQCQAVANRLEQITLKHH